MVVSLLMWGWLRDSGLAWNSWFYRHRLLGTFLVCKAYISNSNKTCRQYIDVFKQDNVKFNEYLPLTI